MMKAVVQDTYGPPQEWTASDWSERAVLGTHTGGDEQRCDRF
jgi:hypothetical protein